MTVTLLGFLLFCFLVFSAFFRGFLVFFSGGFLFFSSVSRTYSNGQPSVATMRLRSKFELCAFSRSEQVVLFVSEPSLREDVPPAAKRTGDVFAIFCVFVCETCRGKNVFRICDSFSTGDNDGDRHWRQ